MQLFERSVGHKFGPHRLCDVQSACVRPIVLRQITARQRAVVSDQCLKSYTALRKDWIAEATCVDEMHVAVDDWKRIFRHGGPPFLLKKSISLDNPKILALARSRSTAI